jgi:hypothetical protein
MNIGSNLIRSMAMLGVSTFCLFSSCKKILNIPPPVGSILTEQVFTNDAQAVSAATGMYYNLIVNEPSFANVGSSLLLGMSADELTFFNQSQSASLQFQDNKLVSSNNILDSYFWQNPYSVIYIANSVIEGLNGYNGVNDSLKNQLIGQAEFIRAYCDFYLVNLFGAVPLVTTINYNKTDLLTRSPVSNIYAAMVADLKDAQSRLLSDYSASGGQRIIPNKFAASALLARVYLYMKDYIDAQSESSNVLANKSLYGLDSISNIFMTTSNEAIFQLQQVNTTATFNVTPDGYWFIPAIINSTPPYAYLTNTILQAFEPGDERRSNWIDSTVYNNITYYFPYKYKDGRPQINPGGPDSEYTTILRLAEQYLIRAEAEAETGDLGDAIADLNVIRMRAGLSAINPATQSEVLSAIIHERQVEFFAEGGYRWFDLKRTGMAASILSSEKNFAIDSAALLFPIPLPEIRIDPNLTQNPDYQ